MALIDTFKVDRRKVTDGVWASVDVNEDGSEIRFKLAYIGGTNKKLAKLTNDVYKPYRRLGDRMPDKLAEQLARKVFIKGVLLDWENVILKKGEPALEFNEANAEMLFNELPTLLDLLTAIASEFSNFKSEGDEEAAKN